MSAGWSTPDTRSSGFPTTTPGYSGSRRRCGRCRTQQRQHSLLPLLHNYQRPEKPINGSFAPTERFRAAVQEAKVGPDKDIPHVTKPIIIKYITNLQLLGLL